MTICNKVFTFSTQGRKVLIKLLLLLCVFITSHAIARELNRFELQQLHEASTLLEKHEYGQAYQVLKPMLEKDKPHVTIFRYACQALTDSGEEAISCWEKAYILHPSESSIVLNFGNSLLQNGEFKRAITLLTTWEHSHEATGEMKQQQRYMLGYAYYQLQAFRDVIKVLIQPPVEINWWSVISYSQLATSDWQGAQNSAQNWLMKQPDNSAAWQILTRSAMGQMNLELAAISSDISQLITPVESHHLSSMFGQLKAYNFAADCLDLFHETELNTTSLACLQYAWLSGRQLDGLRLARNLTPVDSNHDEYYLLVGHLYAQSGDAIQARISWEQVGTSPLPTGSPSDLKYWRKKRSADTTKALLLIGQSYWLEKQWLEAETVYRKLRQIPESEVMGLSFIQQLQAFGMIGNKLR